MSNLRERFQDLEKLAYGAGLRPYDVHYFMVPANVIYEISSYGLPVRYSHWTFGRVYEHQRTYGEMGFSKVYELILNNNPSYAFLDQNNPDTINLMIAAHCLAHSDVFRNNVMFIQCDETDMVDVSKRHAEIVDNYRQDYGDEEVDEWLDIAIGLEHHIDVYRGRKREPYPKRRIEYEERSRSEWEDIVGKTDPLVSKVTKGLYLPPHPEKDFLWFLSEYANLEPWQQHLFEIVRRESYYFFPQFRCKIIHEGWASFWHAEIMRQYSFGNNNEYGAEIQSELSAEEHLDFAATHEKVVQAGVKIPLKVEEQEIGPHGPTGKTRKVWNPIVARNPALFHAATRINPYYLGFRLFRYIKEQWDGYYEQGYREDEWGDHIPVTINGNQKIREVMEEEDDVSFLKNYLTEEIVDELKLFAYGSTEDYDDNYVFQDESIDREKQIKKQEIDFGNEEIDTQIIHNRTIKVRTKKVKDIVTAFSKVRSNYGVPNLVIRRVDDSGLLRLEHLIDDSTNLDIHYAGHVLKYIYRAWGRPVEIIRKADDCTYILKYDGQEVDLDWVGVDANYPESVEKNASPSSW